MRKITLLFLLFTSFLKAQSDSTVVDHKYLEDQLYFNLTYIQMLNLPNQIEQSGFSFGLSGGFIKDLPLNENRNIGLGAGIGYGFNNYYFNMHVNTVVPGNETETIKNNKMVLHSIEVPVELRFRNSTPVKYKFWRFYPGIKFAYVFTENTSFGRSPDFDVDDVIRVSEFLYGLTFSAGYNKWNVHLYYGLNDLFTNTVGNEYSINISDFKIGLIFYIF